MYGLFFFCKECHKISHTQLLILVSLFKPFHCYFSISLSSCFAFSFIFTLVLSYIHFIWFLFYHFIIPPFLLSVFILLLIYESLPPIFNNLFSISVFLLHLQNKILNSIIYIKHTMQLTFDNFTFIFVENVLYE